MRHHCRRQTHPVAAFLIFLILSPYLLAAAAILAIVWLICFIVAVAYDVAVGR